MEMLIPAYVLPIPNPSQQSPEAYGVTGVCKVCTWLVLRLLLCFCVCLSMLVCAIVCAKITSLCYYGCKHNRVGQTTKKWHLGSDSNSVFAMKSSRTGSTLRNVIYHVEVLIVATFSKYETVYNSFYIYPALALHDAEHK